MAADSEPELKLEIAHVLTIDVVAYSTLLIHDQSRVMAELTKIVRNAPRFRAAEAEGKLTRLPTGDGMALVFFGDPEAPIECAMQISTELKDRADIRLRMGIHSGPVNQILDVNDRSNVAGAGIDMAQRVMDCGDAGHILVSKRVADDLAPYSRWNRHLHDLGECEVKHGRKVSVFNFYSEKLGNPIVPKKLKLAQAQASESTRKRRRLLLAGSVILLLFCLGAGLFYFQFSRPVRRAIAVLPFIDQSPGKDQEYFSDEMTEELINTLMKIRGLRVAGRSSSFVFKNKSEDIRKIGKLLDVTHVLEGSINRAAGRVRVYAQLVEVATGHHLWAESYDANKQDALSLQSDVARKVARALRIELQLQESREIAKLATNDPEAYDLYLRGRHLLNKRTVESIRQALRLFQESITRDAQFALGRVGVADVYILLGKIGAMTGEEAAAHAWPEVSSALALDPELADGYVSRAILLNDFEWNWPAAEADFQKALALNPNSASAHHWYARHLAQAGRTEEALREISAALSDEPLSPTIRVAKGRILFLARRYEPAIQPCRHALELEPNFASAYQVLGQIYTQMGDFAQAIEATQKYVELSQTSGWSLLELAYAQAMAGNRAEADRIVQDVMARSVQFSPYDMATIHAATGDADGAIAWLEKAIEQRSVDVILIRMDPRLDKIRSDARFEKVVERMKPRR